MIVEKSKMIAEFMGWQYVPHNSLNGFPKAGWWQIMTHNGVPIQGNILSKHGGNYKDDNGYHYRFICRNHKDLRFYNSMDLLITVLDKFNKCYGLTYVISPNIGTSIISKGSYSFSYKGEGMIKNTFEVCVKTIETICSKVK